jgi:hypothetical protein
MLLLATALLLAQDTGRAFDGRARQLDVAVPRLEATIAIDGVLDEPVWTQAARLTGFSQYQPVDGQAAVEPTEILVWYGPDAIYFGVRAREIHGDVVHATRANRDNIGSEDQIQILLDTYHDRRRAFLFGVNPLGVQQDGIRSDQFGGGAGGRSATGGGVGMNPLEGTVDLNPDYYFESKGRLVPGGYEVEIRIPFKSLRYQEGDRQTWGINVLRRIQHTGFQDSWAPALRANASFLGQSGALTGLHDMRRGMVLELTPTATGHLDGAADTAGRWGYARASDFGADVRWGITQNLTLNGTANPDFSQVEADVGQVLLNERFALFYPEKRPFFLDGLEQFDTPNQLIYTRRIADPDAGLKLAGKVGGTNVGALFSADNRGDSWGGGHAPLFGVLRVRRDLGRNSNLGLVATTREDGGDFSRLLGGDIRLYHSRLYFVEVQAVQSWTDSGGAARRGPLLQAMWDRTGRNWGFNYSVRAIAPDFRAAAGFVNRTGIVDAEIFNRLTGYGAPDALIQTYSAFFIVSRFWSYTSPSAGPIEGGESVSPSATLRGGWQLSGGVSRRFYSFDPASYAGYQILIPCCTLPPGTLLQTFTVPGPERDDWGWSLGATTPTYRFFTASASIARARVPIFREAAPGRSTSLAAAVDLRPTPGLRVSLQATRLMIDRRRDGSRFSTETIPRLKVEYQLTRAIFFRLVGQYTARDRDALYDVSGFPIYINGAVAADTVTNEFRMDWLFSYRPSPGTLVYLGYGSTLDEPQAFRFNALARTSDGFFAKVSYLFRL